MKKVSKLLVALLMFILAAFAIMACEPANDVTEIRIDTEGRPSRVTFVQGQDLDFFGGELTVVKGDSEEIIPLDSTEITITGYDKNALGQQRITISYGGQSTTLDVKVVKRIVVEIESKYLNYFVGEEFNRTYGKITLTKDDGSVVQRNLVDTSVVIEGLDTFADNAGVNVLTVSYGGYSDTFEVNVNQPADVSFKAPSEITYDSHETEIDLTGGVITFKDAAAANSSGGGITKTVYLTKDMISGFNPAAATYEDNYEGIEGNSDLMQEITVNYAGRTFKYNVYIDFSDVSLVKYYAGILAEGVDWTNEELEFTQDQLDMALEAAELYFAFEGDEEEGTTTESLQALVTDDEKSAIMSVATHYAYMTWLQGILQYDDAIALSVNPEDYTADVNFVGATYDEAVASLARLQEPEFAALSEYNTLLWRILSNDELAYLTMYEYQGTAVTLLNYCTYAVDQATVNFVLGELEFAIELYEQLEGVTIADVTGNVSSTVKEKVEGCYTFITESAYYTWTSVFATVSAWTDGEFFDILYKYYYDYAVNDSNCSIQEAYWDSTSGYYYGYWNGRYTNEGLNALVMLAMGAYMPDELYNFYYYSTYAFSAFEEDGTYISQYGGILDASVFLNYYIKASNSINEIKNGNNQLYKNLLNVMGLTYSFNLDSNNSYIPVVANDVIAELDRINMAYYVGNFMDIAAHDQLIKDYLVIVDSYVSNRYVEYIESEGGYTQQYTDAFYTEIKNFFEEQFLSYSFTVQSEFLYTICNLNVPIFDMEGDAYVYITALLSAYYDDVLDDETYSVFAKLMLAFESYLIKDRSDNGLNLFYQYLLDGIPTYDDDGDLISIESSASADYAELTSTQKAEISFLYDYLIDLTNLYDSNMGIKDIDLSDYPEWEAKFDKLADIMGPYYIAWYYAYSTDAVGTYISSAAAVDNMYKSLVAEIEAVQDEELKSLLLLALDYKEYDFFASFPVSAGLGKLDWTINGIFFYMRDTYASNISMYMMFGETEYLYYYWNDELANRIAGAGDIMNAMALYQFGIYSSSQLYNVLDDNDDFFKSYIAMDGEWTLEQKVVYSELHYYYDVLQPAFWMHYGNKLGLMDTTTGEDVISCFMNLIYAHMYYDYYLNVVNVDNSSLNQLATQYQSVLSTFNSYYNKLSATNKAAFDAEFGADLVQAYRTAPTRR